MKLRYREIIKVILQVGQDVAPETSEAPRRELDALLRTGQGEVVSDFMLTKVAVLDHGSAGLSSLAHCDYIKIGAIEYRVLLNTLAVGVCLFDHVFEHRAEYFAFALWANHDAAGLEIFAWGSVVLLEGVLEVDDVSVLTALGHTVVNERWKGVVPVCYHVDIAANFCDGLGAHH